MKTSLAKGQETRGGHLNCSVAHMRDQSNMKKGLFLEAKCNLRELQLEVKMCIFFRKRVLLDSIKGRLGVIFKTPANSRQNHTKFPFRGCFPGKGKSRLGYVLKTYGHTCVQH